MNRLVLWGEDTLAVAREQVRRKARDGVRCPCCDRYVKVWRKKIISTAAASLVRLVRLFQGRALHIKEFTIEQLPGNGNFSQLRLWDLIEPDTNEDETKRASGRWYPTELGILFARDQATVLKYVWTDDNVVVEREGPPVGIVTCLGNRYNHAELLAENYVGRR